MLSIKSSRVLILLLTLTLFFTTSAIGMVMITSFITDSTENSVALEAYAHSAGITAIVGEYNAFLTAAAQSPAVLTAVNKPDAETKAEAVEFAKIYAENQPGVYDILITDKDGYVLTDVSGDYEPAEPFRDVEEMLRTAFSPAPVSGFYEGGKFYCVKPVKFKDENNEDNGENNSENKEITMGYIILETSHELTREFVTQNQSASSKIVFAILDENGRVISSEGEVSRTLSEFSEFYKKNPPAIAANKNHENFKKNGQTGAIGGIAGTKWRWIAFCPSSEAASQSMVVFFTAFSISAAVCAVNVVVLVVWIKKNS